MSRFSGLLIGLILSCIMRNEEVIADGGYFDKCTSLLDCSLDAIEITKYVAGT